MTTLAPDIDGEHSRSRAASPRDSAPTHVAEWREPAAALALIAALVATIWLDPTATGLANLAAIRTVAALVALVLLGPTLIFIPGRTLVATGLISTTGLILLVRYKDTLLPAQSMIGGIQLLTGAVFVLACTAVAARRPKTLLVGAFAACMIVTAELAWTVARDGLSTERLAGLLGYRNASAGAVAAFGIGLVALWASQQRWMRVVGALGAGLAGLAMAATLSRGALAAMVIGVVVLVWLWRSSSELGNRSGAVAGGAGMMATAVATMALADSPAAWVAVCVGAAGLAAIGVPHTWPWLDRAGGRIASATWGTTTRKRGTCAAAAVLVLVFGVTAGPSTLDQFRSTEVTSSTSTERLLQVGSNQRWQWWGEAVAEWKTAPMLGHGTGAFSLRRQDTAEVFRPAQRAHSGPLQLLAEVGLVGVALLAVAGALLILGFARTRTSSTPLVGTLCGAGLAGAGALALQGSTDWTLSLPLLSTLFILLIAASSNPAPAELPEPRDPRSGTAWLILSPAVLLPLAIAPAWAYWHLEQGEKNLAAAFVRLDKGDTKGAKALFIKAEKDGAATWRILPEPRALDLRVNALLSHDKAQAADSLLQASMPLVRNDRGSWQLEYDMALLINDGPRAKAALARYKRLNPRS